MGGRHETARVHCAMSAIGTKRTFKSCHRMSAFGVTATSGLEGVTSAFDPKQTLRVAVGKPRPPSNPIALRRSLSDYRGEWRMAHGFYTMPIGIKDEDTEISGMV
jgi:hypothetical protein